MTKLEIIKTCIKTPTKKEIKVLNKALDLLLDEVLKLYVPDGNPQVWMEKIKELKTK